MTGKAGNGKPSSSTTRQPARAPVPDLEEDDDFEVPSDDGSEDEEGDENEDDDEEGSDNAGLAFLVEGDIGEDDDDEDEEEYQPKPRKRSRRDAEGEETPPPAIEMTLPPQPTSVEGEQPEGSDRKDSDAKVAGAEAEQEPIAASDPAVTSSVANGEGNDVSGDGPSAKRRRTAAAPSETSG